MKSDEMNQDNKYHTVNMRKYFLKRTTINNDTLDNWTPRDHPIGYRSEEPDASNNVLYTLRVIVNPLIMHNERQLSGVVWCGVVSTFCILTGRKKRIFHICRRCNQFNRISRKEGSEGNLGEDRR